MSAPGFRWVIVTPDGLLDVPHAEEATGAAPDAGRDLSRGTTGDGERTTAGIVGAAVFAALMVQTWFGRGTFIAAGDSGPWVEGVRGVTRSWGDRLAGTGSTGYRAADLVPGLLHDALASLGASSALGQRVWYTLVVAGCAAAVAWAAAAVTRRPVAVGAAGLVAALAPFHLHTLPNVLPLLSISAVALVVGWAARTADGRAVHPTAGVVLGVVLGPVAKNLPLLAVVLAVLAVCAGWSLWRYPSDRRRVLASLAWFGAGSLYWLVPLAVHFASGTPGLTIAAQVDVDAWSWTQRNSGPSNVVRLVASYVWGDPDIMGSMAGLADPPWSLLGWALPVGVVLAFVAARHRPAARVAAAVAAGSAVLCVGINAPFGPLNRFLYQHVPGFFLFRQPMAKFGVLLVVAYAVLIAVGIDALISRLPTWSPPHRRTAVLGAGLLAVAVFAFAHPLWTGSVVRGQRGGATDLPPEEVRLPGEWTRAAAWLDDAPLDGSVVVLPLSDYYQQGTTWGFYGVNDLVSRLVDRPALNLLPGGYYDPAGSAPALMRALQSSILAGDGPGAARLMAALGASYVAIRTDLTDHPVRPTAAADDLIASADRLPQLRAERRFEVVRFYSAGRGAPTTAADAAPTALMSVAPGLSPERLADVVASTPAGTAVIDGPGASPPAEAWLPTGEDPVRQVTTGDHPYVFSVRRQGPLVWQAVRDPQRPGTVVVSPASTVSADGEPLAESTPLVLESAHPVAALEVGGRTIGLDGDTTFFEADQDATVRPLLGTAPDTVAPSRFGAVGNCNNAADSTLREAGISAGVGIGSVELTAGRGSACVAVDLWDARTEPGGLWRISGDFWRSDPGPNRLCVWWPEESRCLAGTPPATAVRSGTMDFVVAAPADPGSARLVLYADADAARRDPSVVRWTDLTVSPVSPDLTAHPLPRVRWKDLELVPTDRRVGLAANPALLRQLASDPSTGTSDCNNYDDLSPAEAGLDVSVRGQGRDAVWVLRARRHSACTAAMVSVPPGLDHVTVSFRYRSAAAVGRWCLLGPDSTCEAEGRLAASPDWTTVERQVVLERGDGRLARAGGHRLYFYADGAGRGEADRPGVPLEVTDVGVRSSYPVAAVARPVLEDAPDGDAPLLVVQRTAHSGLWGLRGLPGGARSRPVVVDGWANGWVVTGTAPGERLPGVTPVFRGDLPVSLAVWSLLPVLVLAAAARFAPRRRRKPTPGGAP